MLVDSHCHLDARAFSRDRDGALERARAAGVGAFVVPATSPGLPAVAGAGVALAAGCHPYEADSWEEGRGEVAAGLESAVAVGETGLDFAGRCPAGRDAQLAALRGQMEMAAERGLPVILHERDSFAELVRVVLDYPGVTGVFHAFHHGPAQSERVLEAGWLLGLGGMLTYPGNDELRAAAAAAPLDRLLLETDAPWLPPQSKRGGRNEPAYITETARRLAEVRGVSAEEVESATSANASRLFGLGV